MKVFVVGSDKVYAIENLYVKYLQLYGCEVFHYAAQSKFFDFYYNSLYNKLLFRLGFSTIITFINEEIIRKVSAFMPDVFLVFKGMEVLPSTLKFIKKLGIKLVNYNPDNPFIFSGSGSGNKNMTQSFCLYDLHLTYNSSVRKRIQNEYDIRVEILPFGFEVSDRLYLECLNEKEILKVCFLGNPDRERADFINELAHNGVQLDLYGNNWEKFVSHSNLEAYPPVYGDELWKTLRRYRVQLNLMRKHNLDSHNMRSFEVPGVGGIMLAPRTGEHELYFENNKEVFLYASMLDCSEIAERLLNFSISQANQIRQWARCRSIDSGYTYKDRTSQLLTELQKL